MAKVRYTRKFKLGDQGIDVEAVGHALCRAGRRGKPRFGSNPMIFRRFPKRVRRTWGVRKRKWLRQFKRQHGLKADATYGPKAHVKLSPFFDSKDRKMMRDWEPPHHEENERWRQLYAAMQELHRKAGPYLYSGGHGTPLDSLDANDRYDCSSSTSKVLRMAGMFPWRYALDSSNLATSYGVPGKGRYFTVYAKSSHAWIRIYKSVYWRFDTSAYGDAKSGRSGPRLRFLPRPTWGYTARHWPGM